MLPDIGGWESCPTCSIGPLDVDRAVVSHTDDSPLIAVLHPTAGGGQAALVAASDDQISYAHNGSVGRLDPASADRPGQDAVGPCPVVEVQHGLGVVRDHQRPFPSTGVVAPRLVEQVEHGLPVPALDPAVLDIHIGGVGAALAQVERRGSFPLVAEPADVMQLRDVVAILGEQVERPTRADRGQLRPVPHQQHLGPSSLGLPTEGVELESAGHERLVHNHQLPRSQ